MKYFDEILDQKQKFCVRYEEDKLTKKKKKWKLSAEEREKRWKFNEKILLLDSEFQSDYSLIFIWICWIVVKVNDQVWSLEQNFLNFLEFDTF